MNWTSLTNGFLFTFLLSHPKSSAYALTVMKVYKTFNALVNVGIKASKNVIITWSIAYLIMFIKYPSPKIKEYKVNTLFIYHHIPLSFVEQWARRMTNDTRNWLVVSASMAYGFVARFMIYPIFGIGFTIFLLRDSRNQFVTTNNQFLSRAWFVGL